MANARDLLFLPGNARHADLGLLLLRIATGVFLIYLSHDNVFSAARMDEFEQFLAQFGFAAASAAWHDRNPRPIARGQWQRH